MKLPHDGTEMKAFSLYRANIITIYTFNYTKKNNINKKICMTKCQLNGTIRNKYGREAKIALFIKCILIDFS